jgi:DNA-directed RNA polymerase subunit F
MGNPEIVSETPVSMHDLKEELVKIKKRDKELNYRATKVEEYLNQFVHLKNKQYTEIKEKIEKLQVPRLRELHIYKILDVMPANIEELKTILQGYTITVSNENLKKIVDIITEITKDDGKKA